MYVNSLEPTSNAPVVLGNLYVEYDSKNAMADHAEIKMPPPPTINASANNPIVLLAKTAALAPSEITKVTPPLHYYDGSRGLFFFKKMPDAVNYDIYISLYPDGRNALKLGNALKKSGAEVNNFRANTDFYAFVVYQDAKGAHSKPSGAFKFNMANTFGNL